MYPHQYTSQSTAPQGYASSLSTSSQSSHYQTTPQPQGYSYTTSSGTPQTYTTSLPHYGYQTTNPLSYTSTSYQPYTSSYTSQTPSYNYTQTAQPTTYESVTKSSAGAIPSEPHATSSYANYGSVHHGEPKASSYTSYTPYTPYTSSHTSSYTPTTGSYTPSSTSYLQTQPTVSQAIPPTQISQAPAPQINVARTQKEVVAKSSVQPQDTFGVHTPLTTHTMHEKDVLKTPRKNELTLDYDYARRSVESGRASLQATPRSSMLEPYRKSMYPEFDLVEDLPDRTFLIGSINDTLRKSQTKESLLTMPTRVSILRNSTYSPAKIEVEYLLKEKYEDGSVYEGEGKRGLRHGKGTIVYPDGTVYEGDFIGGKMSGSGKLVYPDGQLCYQGEYDNDKFEGQGVLYNDRPVELTRAFDYREFSHLGNVWLKYEGKFKNDMKNGVGTLYLINGERFYGEFENDRIHGKGTFYLLDGSTVTGVWEDNKLKESF